MDCHPTVVPSKKARKTSRNPGEWKSKIMQKQRYAPKSMPDRLNCSHNNKRYQCAKLSMKMLQDIHEAFYKIKTKSYQDSMIMKYCTPVPIKKRKIDTISRKHKQFYTKYTFLFKKVKVNVCQKVFLSTLGIKKDRVQNLVSKFFLSGTIPQETRGGDRKLHILAAERLLMNNFISSLICSEPHYCRSKTSVRKYLPSELSVNKLYKMFIDKHPQSITKASYFRKHFNTSFNLGFGSPATDKCSKCIQFEEQIKKENDKVKKNSLLIEKRVHTLRAKAFFSFLKEKKTGVKIISYDCQKNLPLPKLPDQSFYYSRQLNFYNLTVVEGSSKDPLNKNNVFSYVWQENLYTKDSNLVASVIFYHLNKVDLHNIHTIRLISDGCGGQNKNSMVVSMCAKWLLEHPSVKTVELIFPITGHSYMPSDRVFGMIEKEIKKRELIVDPKVYVDIISNFATVVEVDKFCRVSDWRQKVGEIMKPPGSWHFQFLKSRRFLLKRSKREGNVLIRGEQLYKSDHGQGRNVCKPGKIIKMIEPSEIQKGVLINYKKIQDIKKLLCKHYGDEWSKLNELQYYEKVFDEYSRRTSGLDTEEIVVLDQTNECTLEICEHLEEIPELLV